MKLSFFIPKVFLTMSLINNTWTLTYLGSYIPKTYFSALNKAQHRINTCWITASVCLGFASFSKSLSNCSEIWKYVVCCYDCICFGYIIAVLFLSEAISSEARTIIECTFTNHIWTFFALLKYSLLYTYTSQRHRGW